MGDSSGGESRITTAVRQGFWHGTQVFDHIPDFRPCGAGVGLKVNGFAALGAIDSNLCQTLLSKKLSIPTVVAHSLDGAYPILHQLRPYDVRKMKAIASCVACRHSLCSAILTCT